MIKRKKHECMLIHYNEIRKSASVLALVDRSFKIKVCSNEDYTLP